ncbi:hypothetical protein ACVRY7_01385 [Streptococcus ictaluri]|uniref:Uncharacterized protein n=1 Tax=Streptococcus ictaluri 707-05 TaxID=764299 RepID=G5K4N3_9STRE|nr:hypothetical protein STRIC_1770 [Streptococcus ictaluri 707-05]
MSSQKAILIGSILGVLIYGLLHLPTYEWSFYQCLVVIGLGRLPFTYLWFKEDSLRAGIYSYVLYDYWLFALIIFFTLIPF